MTNLRECWLAQNKNKAAAETTRRLCSVWQGHLRGGCSPPSRGLGMLVLGGVPVGCVWVPAPLLTGAVPGLLCGCCVLLSVEVAAGEVAASGALDVGRVEAGVATVPGLPGEPGAVVVVWAAAPVAPEIPPETAGAAFAGAIFCPMAVPLTTSSTRRLSWRPAAFELEATGSLSAKPSADTLPCATPWLVRKSRTASARLWESASLISCVPVLSV